MKKPQLIVIVVLTIAALFLLSRNCGLTDKYKLARDDYNELAAITETDKKISDEKIQHLTNAIGHADETIVQLSRVIAEKTAQITGLSSQLDELIDSEPVQPELEKEPLVINLRGQINKLSNMFSLSQQTITLQSEEIEVLRGKCTALESIGTEWKQQYDKEHALRLSADKLVTSLEKRVKSQGLLGKVKTVAVVAIAGGLAYSILKKK